MSALTYTFPTIGPRLPTIVEIPAPRGAYAIPSNDTVLNVVHLVYVVNKGAYDA